MTPIQIIGLGATGLFAYKAFDSMQGMQAANLQATQLGGQNALLNAVPGSPQAAMLATSRDAASTLQGNMMLFGALSVAALGATVLLWNHE